MRTRPSCLRCFRRRDGIYARGLCNRCYQAVQRLGDLGEYPTTVQSSKDRADLYLYFKEYQGMSVREAAQELGCTPSNLYTALRVTGVKP